MAPPPLAPHGVPPTAGLLNSPRRSGAAGRRKAAFALALALTLALGGISTTYLFGCCLEISWRGTHARVLFSSVPCCFSSFSLLASSLLLGSLVS